MGIRQGGGSSPKEVLGNNLASFPSLLALNLPSTRPWNPILPSLPVTLGGLQVASTNFASLISPTPQPALLTGPTDGF